MGRDRMEQDSDVVTLDKDKLKRPHLYKVLLHNDDYTTMDFVVLVLQKFFNMTYQEAEKVMLKVHYEGIGICGIYTYEIAETKRVKVSQYAKENKHPLLCTIERE